MVGDRKVQGLWGPNLGCMANGYQCSLQFWLRGGGLKEKPCVVGGVVIDVFIIVVQEETVRPRTAIVRVEDNEVDYLFRHFTFGVGVAR